MAEDFYGSFSYNGGTSHLRPSSFTPVSHPLATLLKGYKPQSKLHHLLARVAAKVEERSRQPWFDLQKTHFYQNKSGIKDPNELRRALEHFHVMLSETELHFLYTCFPQEPNTTGGSSTRSLSASSTFANTAQNTLNSTNNSNNTNTPKWFNFKQFADALFPDESNNSTKLIREGRYVEPDQKDGSSQYPTYVHPDSIAASASASSSSSSASHRGYYLDLHGNSRRYPTQTKVRTIGSELYTDGTSIFQPQPYGRLSEKEAKTNAKNNKPYEPVAIYDSDGTQIVYDFTNGVQPGPVETPNPVLYASYSNNNASQSGAAPPPAAAGASGGASVRKKKIPHYQLSSKLPTTSEHKYHANCHGQHNQKVDFVPFAHYHANQKNKYNYRGSYY